MTPAATVAQPAKSPHRSAEMILAVTLTLAIVALHVFFLSRVGGLFRDEVNSVNLAHGPWLNMTHDAFPVLFPFLLRLWCGLGLDQGDLPLRCFGVLMSVCLTAGFWISARWLRRQPPLWSLVFVAVNAWVIYYGAWLRAYGLGSAAIALCAGAAWLFLEKPVWKNWLLFAIAATLSVQSLYQNTALVAAICAGGCAVGWRQKKFQLAVGMFFGGLVAAISLLPYFHIITGMPQNASPLRMDFDRVIAFDNLDTMLAFPLPQFSWVWCALSGTVLLHAIIKIFSANAADRALFAAVTMLVGFVAFMVFLRLANFPVQPWYFLPLMALTAVAFEAALPRLEGKFRALLWGGIGATAILSAAFAVRVLDYRFTNVDLLARKANALATENDFVIVGPWQFGITFGHYFTNRCAWETLPPMADHSGERYDLLLAQMQNTNAMQPLLERVAGTLRAGHNVWVAGDVMAVAGTNLPPSQPPPPLPRTGWNETPYRFTWNNQLGWFLHRHATNIECLDRGTNENVNLVEQSSFYKASGWKNP